MAHGLSCSAACGILPEQGSNPCPLHWQADTFFLYYYFKKCMYLFIFGCVGPSLLHAGFLWLRRAGLLFVVVRGLLIAVASLVAEHRL